MRLCQVFSQDTENFADAHLDAIKYAVVTKERIELFQGLFVAAIFLCSAAPTAEEVKSSISAWGGRGSFSVSTISVSANPVFSTVDEHVFQIGQLRKSNFGKGAQTTCPKMCCLANIIALTVRTLLFENKNLPF